MKINYLHPNVWQPYEQAKLKTLSEKERAYARTLLTEFHNRHIGIPVGLAASLTKALQALVSSRQLPTPWKEVRSRLERELVAEVKGARKVDAVSRSVGGVMFNAASMYVIQRIALPLIERACRELGFCFLFSEDDENAVLYDTKSLDSYEAKISALIVQYTQNGEKPGVFDLFWAERAAAMFTFTSPVTQRKALPNPDPLASAFMLRLDQLPRSARNYEHLERIHLRRNRHRTRQLHEEGLAGITQTRSLEVIERMLISELMNPDALLADRLMNTGYLVTERLPKRERLRDALIIALLPPEMQERPASDFLRTCWLNTSKMLFQVLLHNNLYDSQILWVEGGVEGSFSVTLLSVEELRFAATQIAGAELLNGSLPRKGFLNLTHWLPELIDQRREKHFLPLDKHGTLTGPVDWLGRLWQYPFGLKRVAQNQERASGSVGQAKEIEQIVRLNTLVQQFAYVHVMTLLPVSIVPKEDQDNLRTSRIAKGIIAELESEKHEAFYSSFTWLNNEGLKYSDTENEWCTYFGAANSHLFQWGGSVEPGNLHHAAQKLAEVWLEEIVREMQRD